MDGTLSGVGGPEGVRPVGETRSQAVGRPDRTGAHAHAQPTPGIDVFDEMELQSGAGPFQAYAKFIVHPSSGVVSIKIIDSRTDQVIREIPSEQVVKIAEEMQAYIEAGRAGKR